MPGDDIPNPAPEEGVTPEQYHGRALLMADLGRYDEAAADLAAGLHLAPADPELLTTLARVHLVADQPVAALAAADRALAAASSAIGPLVARAMALIDTRNFGAAADIAAQLLRQWPDDPYAQRTGAALLSESRNGQQALNAAWAAVDRSPQDAEAHLVLSLVAARLLQFDLAQRAYGEALQLDPAIGEAQHDLGIVRLERRRWARALEALADAAVLDAPGEPTGPAPFGRSDVDAGHEPPPPAMVVRPAGPVLDSAEQSHAAVRRAVGFASGGILVTALVTAVMAVASPGASRVWAAVVAIMMVGVVGLWLRRQLTEPLAAVLRRLHTEDRRLAAAAYGAAASPQLLLAYAAVGGAVPLVIAMVLAALAELAVVTDRR